MQDIILVVSTIINHLSPTHIFIIIALFIVYNIIRYSMNTTRWYDQIQNIKSIYMARMWEYVSGELRLVEARSLDNVYKLLGITSDTDPKSESNREYLMYSLVLERSIHHTMFEAIKNAIRINGFHDMDEVELEQYIRDRANVLLNESRKYINGRVAYYPTLRGTDNDRFTLEDSIEFFRKIVNKSIKLSEQEAKEIEEVKKQYSPFYVFHRFNSWRNKYK